MKPVKLIRALISILIATICLYALGCGEHAEPLDFGEPAALALPGMNAP